MKIISSMRDGNYRQALAVAERTLVCVFPGVTLQLFVDEAMRAMNAAAKLGKAHMQVQGEDIIFLTAQGIKKSPAVEQLLLWVTPQSAAEFIASTSGIPQVMI